MAKEMHPRFYIYDPGKRVAWAYWLRIPELEVSDEDDSPTDGSIVTEFAFVTKASNGMETMHHDPLYLEAFADYLLGTEKYDYDNVYLERGKITPLYTIYLLKEACKLLGTDKNHDPRLEIMSTQHKIISDRAQRYWEAITAHDKAIVLK